MSGGEAYRQSASDLGTTLDPNELDAYMKTGADVSSLRNVKVRNGQVVDYSGGPTGTERGAQPVNPAVQSALDAFYAWKSKQVQTQVARQQYLDLSLKNPGRNATILVPESPPPNNSVDFAAVPRTGQTLLGPSRAASTSYRPVRR